MRAVSFVKYYALYLNQNKMSLVKNTLKKYWNCLDACLNEKRNPSYTFSRNLIYL